MKIKNLLVSFSLLLATWLILNNSTHAGILISGIILSAALSWFFCQRCSLFERMNFTGKSLFYTIIYLGVFTKELVLSNIDVALRVISPKLPIKPAVVTGKTILKSEMARLILANSITLTPGTFTIDITGDTLMIHCLTFDGNDPGAHAHSIIRKFEKYLEVIYG